MRTSSSMNDNNNNQLNQSKRDSTCESSSTTIKEEMTDNDTSTDDVKEIRASQTMVTLKNCPTPEIPEAVLKTSQSSPSALQTKASKSTNKKMVSLAAKKAEAMTNGICNCECKAKDFQKTTLSPDEVKHEIVKILQDVDQITNRMSLTDSASSRSSDSPYLSYSTIRAKTLLSKYSFLYNNNHMTAAAKNQPLNIIKETMIGAQQDNGSMVVKKEKIQEGENKQQEIKTGTSTITVASTAKTISSNDMMIIKDEDDDDELDQEVNESGNEDNIPLMLINLAQSGPITSNVIPAISVLPATPTPDSKNQFNLTKDLEITKVNSISIKTESSFDSVEDEEEPPYVKLKTSLRRFGTMSSLERLPSEDTDEKTLNSSDDDSIEDMKVSTTLIKDLSGESSTQTYRTWTSRAGSFLEESKAFIDKYLGRTDGYSDYMYLKDDPKDPNNDFDEYETIEGEATSGEEVWGTPTSGGENDEMHMFNNGDDAHQMVKKKHK